MFYYTHSSRPDTHLKEVPKHHGEAPETQLRGLNVLAHPNTSPFP